MTVAGGGDESSLGDGGAATAAWLQRPFCAIVATNGDMFISDSGHNRIRKVGGDRIWPQFFSLFVTWSFCLFVCVMCCNQVDTSGTIWAFAGDGGEGHRGDGGPATAASLSLPLGLALSTSGVMYVADFGNNVIRMVRMLVL